MAPLLGRAMLNRGQVKAGQAELEAALKLTGGMRSQISQFDAGLRQDLAQAALLAKQTEDARRYMAYSGAGTQAAPALAVRRGWTTRLRPGNRPFAR
jgi:hypothetical protein